MIDWSACAALGRDPEKVSRSWVFRGACVPVVEAAVERMAAQFVLSARTPTLRLVEPGPVA
jgi:hypothetical protein